MKLEIGPQRPGLCALFLKQGTEKEKNLWIRYAATAYAVR